jgi:hypothetical protein
LETLPDDFGKLNSLNVLTIRKNELKSLPDTIGHCDKLEFINLHENSLVNLPKSMGTSKVKQLFLPGNKLETLPYELWPLETLEKLDLTNNPLSDFEQSLINRDIDTLRDYFHQRSSMSIFVSHAVIDYEPYKLAALGEYLEAKPEVYKVYLCEQDLSGNIDKFMDDNVPISDMVTFLGTQKSVFNSPDCAHELELSEKYQVPVYSMKGTDVSWPDMVTTGLPENPGLFYDLADFQKVWEQIYTYVQKFDQERSGVYKIKSPELLEEFQPSAMKETVQDLDWDQFYQMLEQIAESDDLRTFHKQHSTALANIVKQLQDGTFDDSNFMVQVFQLYVQWAQMKEFSK